MGQWERQATKARCKPTYRATAKTGSVMSQRHLVSQRLVALCALGWVLFNFPFLALFNQPSAIFGIPLLYAYLFGIWAMLVLIAAFIVRRSGRKDLPPPGG